MNGRETHSSLRRYDIQTDSEAVYCEYRLIK
jgi:hypothetical protein